MSKGKRFKSRSLGKSEKKYIIGVATFIGLLILIMILSGYNSKKQAASMISQINEKDLEQNFDATLVSTTDDKSINEVKENNEEKNEEVTPKIAINTSNLNNEILETANSEKEEKIVELHFSVPLEGEIMKDYSDSNLVFSDTLQEWTVHLGIDIKAEKATPVLSSEAGVVESIKNDPRYGITITIEHANGFKTIYSNLQTAEFVSEGEKVEKGKVIGSVGNSAAFEVLDEPHLHFEMTKDGENVNPSQYWK